MIRQYEGGYTDYQAKAESEGRLSSGNGILNEREGSERQLEGNSDSRSTWTHERKLKFSYKEQKEYETIEDDITAIEERMEVIDGEMESCARDFVKLNELTKEKQQLETELEEKMDRWAYLEELAAKIAAQN